MHYAERVDGNKIRGRSDSFKDHYTQATMFLKSQSAPEREHLVEACQFELGKVERVEIRERVIERFRNIDDTFAGEVAGGIGVALLPASGAAKSPEPAQAPMGSRALDASPALSLANTVKDSIRTRCVAVLATEGVSAADIEQLETALTQHGARMEVIAKVLGPITCDDKSSIKADKSHLTGASVFYDAVFVPGGDAGVLAMTKQDDAIHFVQEAFRHCKTLGAIGEGVQLLAAANLPGIDLANEGATVMSHKGVVSSRSDIESVVREFVEAIKQHRHFDRADSSC